LVGGEELGLYTYSLWALLYAACRSIIQLWG